MKTPVWLCVRWIGAFRPPRTKTKISLNREKKGCINLDTVLWSQGKWGCICFVMQKSEVGSALAVKWLQLLLTKLPSSLSSGALACGYNNESLIKTASILFRLTQIGNQYTFAWSKNWHLSIFQSNSTYPTYWKAVREVKDPGPFDKTLYSE